MKNPSSRRIVAKRIKALRASRRWSQLDLAKRAGVSQKTVSNLEDEESHSCQLDKLEMIANAFGIAVWELIKPDGNLTSEKDRAAAQEPREQLSNEAQEFARAFDTLPPDQRAALKAASQAFVDSSKKQKRKVG